MSAGRLVIVCGLPGSGKTTLARALERERRAIRLCPDEWMADLAIDLWDEEARGRVEALQWRLAQGWLALGHTVVIEWGTWGRGERDALREGTRALGAAAELRFLDAPLEVLFARVQARAMEDPPMTMAQMREYDGLIQRPTSEEMALFDSPSVP